MKNKSKSYIIHLWYYEFVRNIKSLEFNRYNVGWNRNLSTSHKRFHLKK